MNNTLVRTLTTDDWQLYRDIRLRALQDAPEAFGSTYARESAFTDAEWMERAGINSRVCMALPLIAEVDGNAAGIACGVIQAPRDSYATLYQMWVDPDYRGGGIGQQLLLEVAIWGRNCGMECLRLAVSTTSLAAIRMYEAFGFKRIGKLEPLRADSAVQMQNMVFVISSRNFARVGNCKS